MGSIISADVDLTRFATADEIAEASLEASQPVLADAPGASGVDVGLPPDLQVPDPLLPEPLPDQQISQPEQGVWLPNTAVHRIPLIEKGLRPRTTAIVIHVNDGYFDGTIQWFSGGAHGVGAHVEIGNDRVWQLASLDQKCWHAVDANAFSIGFEHAGFGKQSRSDWLGAGHELAFSANRASWVLHEYSLGEPKLNHNIFPHSYGGASWGGHACPGANFPWKEWLAMCHDAYHAHWGR
jgi:N-acetyl-anhydromuramyl-L-alanine amidase AmpD